MVKRKILKAKRKKPIVYKETKIRITTNFSSETVQARRKWSNIFIILKKVNLELSPNKNIFKIKMK